MSSFNHTVWKSSNKSYFFLLDDFSNINKLFIKTVQYCFLTEIINKWKCRCLGSGTIFTFFCGLALYSPVLCFVIHYEEFVIWIMLSKMIMRLVFLFCREKGEEIFIHDSSMADEIHSRKLSFSLLGQESTVTFIDSVIWLYALWCKMNVHKRWAKPVSLSQQLQNRHDIHAICWVYFFLILKMEQNQNLKK